jgi:hypothetical protein
MAGICFHKMGKGQRIKGATYERDVAAFLSEVLHLDVRRVLGQARDGGADIHLPGVYVECKRRAAIAVYDWLDQCNKAAAESGSVPIVIARADHQESIVIMKLTDFAPMLSMWIETYAQEKTDDKPAAV